MLLLLENGMIIQCYDSDNCLFEGDTDSCEGYCLFSEDGTYIDGGELDFNSDKIKTEKALYKNLIEFATDKNLSYTILANTSDCAYETFEELLEGEFYIGELDRLIKKVSNDILKARIKRVRKKLFEEVK
ncbi:MAG: hypothetical protein J6S67_03080 [Methanobrevibacter sp.]|nr:hypothetical protein [Methanobrevibacter sp.]